MGDTYTILVTGNDTAGRFCLIDMYVPPGGGPPPHRHNFEEMFTILQGEIDLIFRGEKSVARAGEVNIPANAPHSFKNTSGQPARLLRMCSPAGLEEMFKLVGDRVEIRTAPPPNLSDAEKVERLQRARSLALQLDLRHAAIDKRFDAVDEAAVVGREEHNRFGNFVRSARPKPFSGRAALSRQSGPRGISTKSGTSNSP
jgi:quercetin dioxygenase-like cupin family protein